MMQRRPKSMEKKQHFLRRFKKKVEEMVIRVVEWGIQS